MVNQADIDEIFLSEFNYNNCDRTSGQNIYTREEIRDFLFRGWTEEQIFNSEYNKPFYARAVGL